MCDVQDGEGESQSRGGPCSQAISPQQNDEELLSSDEDRKKEATEKSKVVCGCVVGGGEVVRFLLSTLYVPQNT